MNLRTADARWLVARCQARGAHAVRASGRRRPARSRALLSNGQPQLGLVTASPSGRIYRLGVQVSASELSSDMIGREPEEAF